MVFLPESNCFTFGNNCKGKTFLASQNGGAGFLLHPSAPAPAYASGSAQGRQMRSAPATAHTLSALPKLAPVSGGAPISGVGDFLECQVLRLILLTDLHKAKRAHRPTARIVKRLRDVTARLAAQ